MDGRNTHTGKVPALPTSPTSQELSLLVDTGAAYTWLPRKFLEDIGVRPTRKGRFKTIKGEIIPRDVGHLFVEYEGEIAPTTVVFAEEGALLKAYRLNLPKFSLQYSSMSESVFSMGIFGSQPSLHSFELSPM